MRHCLQLAVCFRFQHKFVSVNSGAHAGWPIRNYSAETIIWQVGSDRPTAWWMKGGWSWWSIRPVVSLYRQQGEQAVKVGGFECPFQPNLPIAIQEEIIIFVSKGGWGCVMQENNTEERMSIGRRWGFYMGTQSRRAMPLPRRLLGDRLLLYVLVGLRRLHWSFMSIIHYWHCISVDRCWGESPG